MLSVVSVLTDRSLQSPIATLPRPQEQPQVQALPLVASQEPQQPEAVLQPGQQGQGQLQEALPVEEHLQELLDLEIQEQRPEQPRQLSPLP